MTKILFSYELGAGLGHLNRLISVAKRLSIRHDLVFAVPHLSLAEPVLRQAFGAKVKARQGASWRPPNDPAVREIPTMTLADILRLLGFEDFEKLLEAASRWEQLLKEESPGLVISDFAPSLRLASDKKVPTVVVGNGFTVPPARRLLPPLRPWQTEVGPQPRAHEASILAACNKVRAKLSGPALDYLADLFQGEATFVCTLAEFDPYQKLRTDQLWPFNIPVSRHGQPFDRRAGPAVFCYLPKDHPGLGLVLKALSSLGHRAEIYVQGIEAQKLAQRCSANVGIHTQPADFDKLLPETSVLLHHAGLGTAYAGLVAAVPQIVLPDALEHTITTRGLQKFGVAQPVNSKPLPTLEAMKDLMTEALTNSARQAACFRAAQQLEARRQQDPVARVVTACNAYL